MGIFDDSDHVFQKNLALSNLFCDRRIINFFHFIPLILIFSLNVHSLGGDVPRAMLFSLEM